MALSKSQPPKRAGENATSNLYSPNTIKFLRF
jgi:hypothetical protein